MLTEEEEKRSMAEAVEAGYTASTMVSLPRSDRGLGSLSGKPFAEVLSGWLWVEASTRKMLAVEGCWASSLQGHWWWMDAP